MAIVGASKIPAAVYAMGVSDNWSRPGQALFRKALGGVRLIDAAVRDGRSKAIWERRLGPAGIAAPRIVRDPGFLAAECYPRLPKPTSKGRRIALCMTHPVALAYHADENLPEATVLTDWLRTLAQAFSARGDEVILFATGSPEDESYMDEVAGTFASAPGGGRIERAPRFASASAMAQFLSTADLVLAHRLHACIAAYAFGVPNIGFTWDEKMLSFFESVDRQDCMVSAVAISVPDMLALADKAIDRGIDLARRDQIVAETQRDIAVMLTKLGAA